MLTHFMEKRGTSVQLYKNPGEVMNKDVTELNPRVILPVELQAARKTGII